MHTCTSTSSPPPNTTEIYNIPTSNAFDPLRIPNDTTHTTQQDPPRTTTTTVTKTQSEVNNGHQKTINTETIDAETIIMCDSNGHHLKPKELCPDSTTKYIRSPTLSQARQQIETSNFTNPNNFIIHCGTNDIEQPIKNTITETLQIVDLIKQQHPNSRILISSLLPRKDELNNKVPTINKEMETQISTKTNTTFIQHTNISSTDLYDKKHLDERGVKKFAKNIKAAYFNTISKKKKLNKTYISSQNRHKQPQHTGIYHNQPSQLGRKNLHPPFKGIVPPPLSFHQDTRRNPLPPRHNQPFQFGRNNLHPPFTPIMNLPSSINQHNNKGMAPPPLPFCQDTRINPLPSQLIGLIRQLYGCINT